MQEGGTLQVLNPIVSNNAGLGIGSDHNGRDKCQGAIEDGR